MTWDPTTGPLADFWPTLTPPYEVDMTDMSDNITANFNALWNDQYAGYSSYIPGVTASVTNPTLGTGPAPLGRFKVFGGNMCHVAVSITWGTSPSVGSGTYRVSLPVAWVNDGISPLFSSDLVIIGTGEYNLVCKTLDTTHVVFSRGDGSSNQVGAAYPSAPTSNWILLFSGVYRCAT